MIAFVLGATLSLREDNKAEAATPLYKIRGDYRNDGGDWVYGKNT